ncbi:MAG: PAS domain S-box protein [Candidatus Latescibacterota bacterium]|jgi:PAS domain S-box-containing protein
MTSDDLTRIARLGAGMAVGLGFLAAAGWLLDLPLLAQWHATFVPMAPSTLTLFIALGSATYARARWPQSRGARLGNWGGGIGALITSGFLLVQSVGGIGADLEELLFDVHGSLHGIPLGRMSAVTAGLFILSSLSLIVPLTAAGRSRLGLCVADGLAGSVLVAGLTFVLAYGYGTPLLYGGTLVPPALTTALAFALLGLSLVALRGKDGWPMRALVGTSMRAVLLRTFLPFITVTLLLEGWVDAQGWKLLHINPALLAAIWVVVFSAIVGGVIILLARHRGDALDRAQQALRESEEHYRLVVENASEAIVVVKDGMPVFVNAKMTELTGCPKEALRSRSFLTLIHPDDRALVLDRYTRRLRGEDVPSVYPIRIADQQGRPRWVEVNSVRLLWERQPATLTFLRDITERRRADEDLRINLALQGLRQEVLQMRSQNNWERFVGVLHQELKKWVSFNACSVNIVNAEEGTLTAYYKDTVDAAIHINPKRLLEPDLLAAFADAMQTGRPIYRKSRHDPLFSERMAPEVNSVVDVPFVGGTLAVNSTEEAAFTTRDLEIVGRFAEVASQAYRRLEDLRALTEAEERFRQAQKLEAVGLLAGGVAHDFNNLLTVIAGYSQLLLRQLEPDRPEHAGLTEIHQASARGGALVRQLLAFSRKQMLRPEVLNLNEVILAFEKMLRPLLGEDVELRLRLDAGLGLVTADAGQFQQVLMNLAVNARDAMTDGGSLTIETANVELTDQDSRLQTLTTPGPYARVSVSDTGAGMDDATQARVFEPFFTTKALGKGTGLGLATVYGIVKQSGGYIWVYSEVGVGTTFRIYLPRIGDETDPPGTPKEEAAETPSPSRGSETVLVAEDDAGLRRLVRQTLEESGYTVLEAADGRAALRIAEDRGRTVHLLVTDVIMPEMNGRELANTLKAMHPEVKVLFMSGYSEGIIDRHGVLDARVSFLEKPFDPATLASKVRALLDGRL